MIYQNTAGGAQAALTAVLPQVPSWERFLQKSSSETKLLVGHLPLTPPCQSHCWTPTWQQHGWDEGCLLFITHLIGSLEACGDGKQLFVRNLAGNVQPQRSAEHCLRCAGLEGPPAPWFVPLGSPAPTTNTSGPFSNGASTGFREPAAQIAFVVYSQPSFLVVRR